MTYKYIYELYFLNKRFTPLVLHLAALHMCTFAIFIGSEKLCHID